MDIRQTLAQAVRHHRSGQLAEAERLYRRVLRAAPGQAEVHSSLGTVLYQLGKPDAALASLRRAVTVDPNYAEGYNNLGLMLLLGGSLDDALTAFHKAIALKPSLADAHSNLGDALVARGQAADAAACYQKALDIEPGRAHTANNLGNVLQAMGRLEEAAACYEKALEINPDYHIARENLLTLNAGQVPHWHFDMLADAARNEAYRAAIEKAVKPNSHVLDIGTGSGLLSMMAARAGAEHVTTCELTRPIAQAAREIIARNGLSDRISVVERQSTLLKIGEDLPRAANVLVSEILDNTLLGEGVLPTLRHAVHNLVTPGAAVIPRSATVLACLIEAPRLRQANPLRDICGFDLSPFERFRDPRRMVNAFLATEEHRRLSAVFPALEFDFTRPPPARTDSHPQRSRMDVEVTAAGSLHGVAFWFELAVDEEIRVSTAPDGELRHWRQLLQFFESDRAVQAGDKLALQISQSDYQIRFSLADG